LGSGTVIPDRKTRTLCDRYKRGGRRGNRLKEGSGRITDFTDCTDRTAKRETAWSADSGKLDNTVVMGREGQRVVTLAVAIGIWEDVGSGS
jgi:hypothetical protein